MDQLLKYGFELAKLKTNDFLVECALEKSAQEIESLILEEDAFPSASTLSKCKSFLCEVEKWKMMSIKCRLGNAAKNSEEEIYSALRGMVLKTGDRDKVLSVMNLKGFGSSIDKDCYRRAKAASSVLRFFYPDTWGVVDWRIMAMLSECRKHHWDIDKINSSTRDDAKYIRNDLDIITEDMCIWLNEEYRNIVKQNSTLVRVADVDMALFQYSWILWK